jgi:hypothetical protein
LQAFCPAPPGVSPEAAILFFPGKPEKNALKVMKKI